MDPKFGLVLFAIAVLKFFKMFEQGAPISLLHWAPQIIYLALPSVIQFIKHPYFCLASRQGGSRFPGAQGQQLGNPVYGCSSSSVISTQVPKAASAGFLGFPAAFLTIVPI